MANIQLIPVPFYDDTLVLADESGTPFVAMKPVVTNMGMAWEPQYTKLTEKFGATITEIVTVAEDGKQRGMVCLPLRKFAAWLYTITPSKVKPELREKIIRYQTECDDVLWGYWTKGVASNPRARAGTVRELISTQREAIRLMQSLKTETNPTIRRSLHAYLEQLCRLLGQPVPAHDEIGKEAPPEPPLIADFWEALEYLTKAGDKLNHARNPLLIAINLLEFEKAAQQRGLRLPPATAFRRVLRESRDPKFVDVRGVNSVITGATVKCWVFETTEQTPLT